MDVRWLRWEKAKRSGDELGVTLWPPVYKDNPCGDDTMQAAVVCVLRPPWAERRLSVGEQWLYPVFLIRYIVILSVQPELG